MNVLKEGEERRVPKAYTIKPSIHNEAHALVKANPNIKSVSSVVENALVRFIKKESKNG